MSRLQDAIDRARREREGTIGQVPGDYRLGADNVEVLPGEGRLYVPPQRRRGKKRTPPPEEIFYTVTRQVELNPKVLERNRVIAGLFDDTRVEAYRQLRTQVMQLFARNNWNSLAITSPFQDAGKTLTAVNLAISLAHETTHTVILVDLDLHKPDVHQVLGLDVDVGVVDVVTGQATIEDVLINPCIPRLVVLPGRPLGKPSSELLSSRGMRRLLQDVTTRYDSRLVIFDLPPLLRNDDALKFTPFADGTLFVVEEGKNTADDVERSVHLLQNANLIGTILNKAR